MAQRCPLPLVCLLAALLVASVSSPASAQASQVGPRETPNRNPGGGAANPGGGAAGLAPGLVAAPGPGSVPVVQAQAPGPQQQCEPISEQVRNKFSLCFPKSSEDEQTANGGKQKWHLTHSKYDLLVEDKTLDAAGKQTRAFSIYTEMEMILMSGCSKEIVPVVCAFIFPPCIDPQAPNSERVNDNQLQPAAGVGGDVAATAAGPTKFFPCYEQCNAVKARCECFIANFAVESGLMGLALWKWPSKFNCERLPRNKNGTGNCSCIITSFPFSCPFAAQCSVLSAHITPVCLPLLVVVLPAPTLI